MNHTSPSLPPIHSHNANSQRFSQVVAYLGPLLLLGALWLLYRLLEDHSYQEIDNAVRSIPKERVLQAIGSIILSYVALTGYDFLALKSINVSLSFPRVALTSFVGYTFSYNLGFALLSGGAVRYRFYSSWGLTPSQIAHVIGFGGFFFWLGLCLLGSLALLHDPSLSARSFHFSTSGTYALAIGLVTPLLLVLGMLLAKKSSLSIGKLHLVLPGTKLTLAALTVACLDWLLAGLTLYLLMPQELSIHFINFLAIFLVAQLAGVLSHVPGGLGVFEATILGLVQQPGLNSSILASLFVFRALYYLFPFLLGLLLLITYEVRFRISSGTIHNVEAPKVPPALREGTIATGLAIATFIAGALLVFSTAVPLAARNLSWLSVWIPLLLVEVSHFISSLIGTLLLILSWGIYRRVEFAHRVTVAMLTIAIILTLPRRGDISTALYFTAVLVTLWPCRHHFRKKVTALTSLSYTYSIGIFSVLVITLWLGFFSYKDSHYYHELWITFAFEGDFSRYLRSLAGVLVLAFIVGGYYLAKLTSTTDDSFDPNEPRSK